jgi:hypothetical protein
MLFFDCEIVCVFLVSQNTIENNLLFCLSTLRQNCVETLQSSIRQQ